MERGARITASLVDRGVTRHAETMKEIDDEIGRGAALREPSEEARLRVPHRVKAKPRSRALREDLTEGAKLGEARRGIFSE